VRRRFWPKTEPESRRLEEWVRAGSTSVNTPFRLKCGTEMRRTRGNLTQIHCCGEQARFAVKLSLCRRRFGDRQSLSAHGRSSELQEVVTAWPIFRETCVPRCW
jgi:hypothetical protein